MINYHDKSMSQGQVIDFRNRSDKLPKETNLSKEENSRDFRNSHPQLLPLKNAGK